MQNIPQSIKNLERKLKNQVGRDEAGANLLMRAGIRFYSPVLGDNKANMGVSASHLPILLIMADGPNPNSPSRGNGRTGCSSTVKASE